MKVLWSIARLPVLRMMRTPKASLSIVLSPMVMYLCLVGLFLAMEQFSGDDGAKQNRRALRLAVVDEGADLGEELRTALEDEAELVGVYRPSDDPDLYAMLEQQVFVGEIDGFLKVDPVTRTSGSAVYHSVEKPGRRTRATIVNAVQRAVFYSELASLDRAGWWETISEGARATEWVDLHQPMASPVALPASGLEAREARGVLGAVVFSLAGVFVFLSVAGREMTERTENCHLLLSNGVDPVTLVWGYAVGGLLQGLSVFALLATSFVTTAALHLWWIGRLDVEVSLAAGLPGAGAIEGLAWFFVWALPAGVGLVAVSAVTSLFVRVGKSKELAGSWMVLGGLSVAAGIGFAEWGGEFLAPDWLRFVPILGTPASYLSHGMEDVVWPFVAASISNVAAMVAVTFIAHRWVTLEVQSEGFGSLLGRWAGRFLVRRRHNVP